jgi:cell division protein FtsL
VPIMPEALPGGEKMKKLLIIVILLLVEISILVFAARHWPVKEVTVIQEQQIKQISCEEGQTYIEACVRELYKCKRTAPLIGL